MSTNPPSEGLVARISVGLLFSALIGTAFTRYMLTRRREKKEKQNHWKVKGKEREEAPVAYMQPMYPVRRCGSLGPSEGGTTFGAVTSSLQAASDAAVHGSPSPSPLPSPPSVVLGQPATAFGGSDLQASQAPREEQNVEGGRMSEEYRSLQEGRDNIPFAELCTDHIRSPLSATHCPPSSTQHPDYSTGAYTEITLSRPYPLPTTPPPLYHPRSPLETPQGQRPRRPRTRRIARDGGVRIEGGDGIPSVYSTRTRTRSVVTIASGTTDNSTPESTNTLPPPYGGSNTPEGSEPDQ